MRGKGGARLRHHPDPGITPARAGKSLSMRVSHSTAQDHPRACGEKSAAMQNNLAREGSPPRVRGKGFRRRGAGHRAGITPARAGKSHASACGRTWFRDHPRACGEKKSRLRSRRAWPGSPPRVRGKEGESGENVGDFRITPARAGKRHPK